VKIHVGFDLTYESTHPTPMIFMLNVHPSRAHDLITPRSAPDHAVARHLALHRRVRKQVRQDSAPRPFHHRGIPFSSAGYFVAPPALPFGEQ